MYIKSSGCIRYFENIVSVIIRTQFVRFKILLGRMKYFRRHYEKNFRSIRIRNIIKN